LKQLLHHKVLQELMAIQEQQQYPHQLCHRIRTRRQLSFFGTLQELKAPTLFEGTTAGINSGSPNAAYWPNTGATGGGGSHVHGGSTFSGTAIDLNVKFYDFIIASKD
jgi:hypothetical protein